MKNAIPLILSLLLFTDASAFVERNHIRNRIGYQELESVLLMGQTWNPYPAYCERKAWDALTGEHKSEIISYGEAYLDYQWKIIKATDYIEFERSGNRQKMRQPYMDNVEALSCLFCAELAEGQGRFIPQIADGVFHFCEMSSWALAAQLHQLSSSRSSMPVKDDNTLAIHQGNTAQLLAWIYHYMHEEFDKLHPEISHRLKTEIYNRQMKPYLDRDDYWWMGFTMERQLNNWTPWCSFSALMTFMLMEEDRDVLARAVWKSISSVDLYLNSIQGDGGIEEGPRYWEHSVGKLYDYLSALKMLTGGKLDMFDIPQVAGMGEYIVRSYVGDGWVVNFADSPAWLPFDNSSLIRRYGRAVGSSAMQAFALQIRAEKPLSWKPSVNVFDFLEQLAVEAESGLSDVPFERQGYTWYPETEFHFHRTSAGMFFAATGGHNNQSHNHNDVGSFNLYYDNLPFIIDPGVGTYTRQTFSSDRYGIWTMQSGYHNVPIINGFTQNHGIEFRSSDVVSREGLFSADISGAYPEDAAVECWTRTYKAKDTSLDIEDAFVLKTVKAFNEIVFMTWGEVRQDKEGQILMKVGDECAVLEYTASDFNAVIEPVLMTDTRLTDVWGDKIYRVRLVARKQALKGRYRYRISSIK